MKTPAEVRSYLQQHFVIADLLSGKRIMCQDEILDLFAFCDAVWIHDGDPKKPHAELTSGLCSNGFFDCMRVLCYPIVNKILAMQLVKKLQIEGIELEGFEDIEWVLGSPYAAIDFSYEVAAALGAVHMFVEKDPTDPAGKKMMWKRLTIPKDVFVLQIEELITTAATMREVRRAVEHGNVVEVNFLHAVGALVHRPPKLPADYGGCQVIAVVEKEVWAVPPAECSLCKVHSVRYRPKTHWAELTGKR